MVIYPLQLMHFQRFNKKHIKEWLPQKKQRKAMGQRTDPFCGKDRLKERICQRKCSKSPFINQAEHHLVYGYAAQLSLMFFIQTCTDTLNSINIIDIILYSSQNHHKDKKRCAL
ncbi:hypothetical protein [Bartonella heixiaziensis]|uniref:hypothetical protein n=1 Tax=Bartonella heixiaziensis TaxID=1461000 RepID=UPI003D1FF3B2